MNDEVNPDTKVADLPAKWRSNPFPKRITELSRGYALAELACADELEAALARQEADNASSPNVIYRWRALDYSGFCYGSNPPHDLPPEACLTAFYRDPEGLRSALHEISATGNMTATDKQFARRLQQIARDALAGAAPPSAPVEQDDQINRAVEKAWRRFEAALDNGTGLPPPGIHAAVHYAAFLRREAHKQVEPTKASAIENAARMIDVLVQETRKLHQELIDAPPAAQAVDLPDDLSESKDWRESDYNGRVDWLKAMHASQRAEIVRLQNDVEILRTLIDQQAGKGVRHG